MGKLAGLCGGVGGRRRLRWSVLEVAADDMRAGNHPRSFRHQRLHGGEIDAFARTGDHRDSALQSKIAAVSVDLHLSRSVTASVP
jgi:hypothetical protein